MEAPSIEQQQLKAPLSAEQDLTEQAPNREPSILPPQRDGGRPIEHQEHHKESSLENNLTDNPRRAHHSEHLPTQNLHKEPSLEQTPQAEQHHYKPSEEDTSSPHYHSKPSPSREDPEESPPEKILMEFPLEHHHPEPSPTQEHHRESSTEKSVGENPLEQDPTTPSIVQEHHKEPLLIDSPMEHHHNEPSPTQERHQETPLDDKVDALMQQQQTKPSPTHAHYKEHSAEQNPAENQQGEFLTDVCKMGTSAVNPQVDSAKKADHEDQTTEQHQNLLIEQSSVDLPIEGQPVESFSPPQQSVLPVVLAQHQEQHGKDAHKKMNPLEDLSQGQKQMNPIIEQNQVNLINEQKPSTQSSENQPLDSPAEQSFIVSSQLSTTEHHLNPSVGQHQTEPPTREEPYSESLAEEHLVEPSIEHTTQHLETTVPADVHGKIKEESTTKQTENFTLQSQKHARAEIDTAAPFESVKAALSLFGERVDWKSQVRAPPQMQVGSGTDRCLLPEPELNKAQEDLMHYKEKLALTQASTAGVLLELKKVKKLIQNPALAQGGTDSLSHKPMEAVDASMDTFMDKPANLELQAILREVETVKEELISATVSTEAAGKGLQDALESLDTVSKRVEELTLEKASLDEALTDAHIALADAEEQVAMLKSGHKADSVNSMPSDFIEKKSAEIKGLESKLEETTGMIEKVKQELLASKEVESTAVGAVVEIEQKMVKAKVELEQAKSEELAMVGQLAKILEQSDDLKMKLENARQERYTLFSTVELLKADVERGRIELDSMHKKEQIACATLASLQEELHKVKEALQSARGGEAKALQAKDTLPAAIKQAASEADEAKAATEASKEEARKARQEIEQVKAATSTAMSRQQAALKELEAARVSEAMALADLKALVESESHGAVTQSEVEGVMGVTISLEEYSALKHAAVEAEGLADKKVAEAVARVEEAKAGQLKAQSKLEDTLKEVEKFQEELQKMQKQADYAQEAKLTAEADLRKWRGEHDQRRKSGGAPADLKAGSTQMPPPKLSSDEKAVKPNSLEKEGTQPPFVQGKKVAGRDSLAQVMSLEVRTPDKHSAEDSTKVKETIKKKNFIRRIASIVVSKRKP